MDSKIYGEECESSESGWTMYIGSSIDDDDDGEDSVDTGSASGGTGGRYDGGYGRKTVAEVDDVDTDDSMASDASSGPGQQVGETEKSQRKYNIPSKKYKKSMHKKKVECENISKSDEKRVVNDQKRVVTTLQSRNTAWFRGRKK